MEKSTKVILIRHGQTEWNATKRYQGHSDIALNVVGKRQAELVGKRLASEPIQAVYSSDLTRAVETAEAIAAQHGLHVVQQPEFREIDFGLWEGLTYEQIMAGWPFWLTAMYARPTVAYAPGGENFPLVARRAMAGLQSCIAAHSGQTIAIVAHGGPLRTLLCNALGKRLDEVWSIEQDSTAVSVIACRQDSLQVESINDTTHLEMV